MTSAVVLISEKGKAVAGKAASLLNAEIISRAEVPEKWNSLDCIVFVGAMGICVRTVALILPLFA